MVAIVSQKREAIRRAVLDMYTAVAGSPQARYHFPIGHAACTALGYPEEMLAGVPERALESFAGVGYHLDLDPLKAGERVLELNCGTGEDAVHLARRGVRVLATDNSPRMLAAARSKIARAG